MAITNERTAGYEFLREMAGDAYYPRQLVAQGAAVLRTLCERIEAERPSGLGELYALTHAATEEFNRLGEAFEEAGSEIETVAREVIGADFAFVAAAYGFADADGEELIAPRDW
ncbi:DUF5713 family protein [Kitasatospora cheerisanensis]|uniref:Uncharacterized protein n=1 Tax=Kitasatospora cheerisanensis KCTC 2395 TaxID=1348663 RepID=A0A066YIL9_9ACTN|nr:DUF5713 family protein [Kitasatospora cheerisanensis]KDN81328.1 hypothetical protein KCH_69600 [Kitasatospora cheerisanensis KCTC 2395]